jgi:galactoside O-acetyltransferase
MLWLKRDCDGKTMSYLTRDELEQMRFASLGSDVRISSKASIYNPKKISIGSNVRIDDFVVLSAGDGGIFIGSHVHIAVYSSLIGAGRITLADFGNLSSRVSIYSSSDDYSGLSLTNPTVPERYKRVQHADVSIGRHVIVGAGSVILPGVTIQDGVAIGALSLVTKDCEAFGIYAGIPAKLIKRRKQNLLELEQKFLIDFLEGKCS